MAEQGSKYEIWFKREAVRLLLENNSIQETIATIQQKHNITISERSLYNWKKKYSEEVMSVNHQPVLFVDNSTNNTMNISPMKNPQRNFDYKKYIEKYKAKFAPHDKKLQKVFVALLDSVDPSNGTTLCEIKDMKLKEKLQCMKIISTMKRDELNMMMGLFSRVDSADDLDIIISALGEAVNKLDSPDTVAIQ